jgi:hypothetical protein
MQRIDPVDARLNFAPGARYPAGRSSRCAPGRRRAAARRAAPLRRLSPAARARCGSAPREWRADGAGSSVREIPERSAAGCNMRRWTGRAGSAGRNRGAGRRWCLDAPADQLQLVRPGGSRDPVSSVLTPWVPASAGTTCAFRRNDLPRSAARHRSPPAARRTRSATPPAHSRRGRSDRSDVLGYCLHDTFASSTPRSAQSVSSAAMSPRAGMPMNQTLP